MQRGRGRSRERELKKVLSIHKARGTLSRRCVCVCVCECVCGQVCVYVCQSLCQALGALTSSHSLSDSAPHHTLSPPASRGVSVSHPSLRSERKERRKVQRPGRVSALS